MSRSIEIGQRFPVFDNPNLKTELELKGEISSPKTNLNNPIFPPLPILFSLIENTLRAPRYCLMPYEDSGYQITDEDMDSVTRQFKWRRLSMNKRRVLHQSSHSINATIDIEDLSALGLAYANPDNESDFKFNPDLIRFINTLEFILDTKRGVYASCFDDGSERGVSHFLADRFYPIDAGPLDYDPAKKYPINRPGLPLNLPPHPDVVQNLTGRIIVSQTLR